MLALPEPRGPVSDALIRALVQSPDAGAAVLDAVPESALDVADPIGDDDLQLALFLAYEPHFRALPGVDERWEWEPSLLALRARLERRFEGALRAAVPVPDIADADLDVAIRALAEGDDGPAVSTWVGRSGTREQLIELMAIRSPHQLREADGHTFAIPRLTGRPKAALVEIQADEYGGGRPDRIHATLFAKALRGMGLSDEYGGMIDNVTALGLASTNLMSLFGLHRRLRGACVGHLALYESTSSVPSRRYATALEREGYGEDVLDFFTEHVEADAAHESIALVDMAAALAQDEPALAADIVWGAATLLHVDGRLGTEMLSAWESGASALRRPLVVPVG